MRDGNDTTPAQSSPANPVAAIGYKNPPREHQFRKGRSPNPKGRPPGSRGRKQIVQEIARETHVVIEDGKQCRRTTLELVLLSLRNSSAKGNVSAFRAVQDLLERYAPERSRERPRSYVILPEVLTIEEWEAEMEKYRAEVAKREAEKALRAGSNKA